MKDNNKILAYIDGTNLYKGIKALGSTLDYKWFYKWLFWKYRIDKAYIFMGYIQDQQDLYKKLEEYRFSLVFKEITERNGIVKGNADGEMILKSVRDFFEQDTKKVIVVTGDGDFSCLIDFLHEKNIFKTMIVPNKKFCSYLLRKKGLPMVFLEDILKSKKIPDEL